MWYTTIDFQIDSIFYIDAQQAGGQVEPGLFSSLYQNTIGLVSVEDKRPGYPELRMAENVCDEMVEGW